MKICEEKLEEFLLEHYKTHSIKDVPAIGYGFRAGWKKACGWILNHPGPTLDDVIDDIEGEVNDNGTS